MDTQRWTIYYHIHTQSGRLYIGLTSQTMLKRWNTHVADALRKKNGWSHFANAIRKYGKTAFSHHILHICDSLEEANLWEEFWIDFYNTRNPELGFNIAQGGAHTPHPVKNPWDRPEFRAKALANLPKLIAAGNTPQARAASKAACRTPEAREKNRQASLINLAKPEVIAKRQAFQKDPTYRAKIAHSLSEALSSPQARDRMSAASKQSATDEVRAQRSASIRATYERPEVKARHAQAVRIAQNQPELLAKRRAKVTSPETKTKLSKAALGRRHTPEAIQRMKNTYWSKIVCAVMEA